MIIIQIHQDKGFEIENNYHEKFLSEDLVHVEKSLQELNELKERIGRQLEKVKAAEYLKEVHVERRKSYDRLHVEYVVTLHLIPALLDLEQLKRAAWATPAHFLSGSVFTKPIKIQYPTTDNRTFPGKERKAAREYARSLAKANDAAIVEE